MSSTTVPPAAAILGFAGLVPFVLPSIALWLAPSVYAPFLNAVLIAYGLAIASFVGGVQWGFGILGEMAADRTWRVLALSVAPALIAWVGALTPFPWPFAFLMVAFALVLRVDFRLVRDGLAPRWYPVLRGPLTAGVLVCLAGALIHALTR
ncbi:MAG: DUF3429 domain-containing protein [Pseudomonadota bacterium]